MKGMILFLASDSIIELFNRIVINSISVLELIVALFAAFIVGMYIFMIYKITFKLCYLKIIYSIILGILWQSITLTKICTITFEKVTFTLKFITGRSL